MATKCTITAEENTGAVRIGTVTFTNADGLSRQVTVTQRGETIGGGTGEKHTLTINLLTEGVTATLTLTVEGDSDYGSRGSATIDCGTPYVEEFAYGAVVGWRVTAAGYSSSSGEVTMTSDQTVNVNLKQQVIQ